MAEAFRKMVAITKTATPKISGWLLAEKRIGLLLQRFEPLLKLIAQYRHYFLLALYSANEAHNPHHKSKNVAYERYNPTQNGYDGDEAGNDSSQQNAKRLPYMKRAVFAFRIVENERYNPADKGEVRYDAHNFGIGSAG